MLSIRRVGLIVLAGAALAAVAGATPAEAAGAIQIVKIQYDTPGADTPVTNKKLNGEFVVIKNKGSKARSLKGWTLRDGQKHVYTFPATKLGAGKTIKVRTGSGTNTAKNRYWGSTYYIWNNTGKDKATLKNKTGKVVDTCAYTGDTSVGVQTC